MKGLSGRHKSVRPVNLHSVSAEAPLDCIVQSKSKYTFHWSKTSIFKKKVRSSTASIAIGIKPCNTPHSSEHWPKYTPATTAHITTFDSLPGTASIFIPNCGTAHEWITSVDVTNIFKSVAVGITYY